jgi:hypothetical protein
MVGTTDYHGFLARRHHPGAAAGFEPLWLPDFLFDFQRHLVGWAVRKGRGAINADCGLGKTPMQLVWAENVVRHTNRPVLFVTTLGDAAQTVDEADKFGVECVRARDGAVPAGARVVVTNYERLHHFDPTTFGGVACNESSAIKDFQGKTREQVTAFLRPVPYRLLCTATAAPNDYAELGTSSEALGELGYQDMLTRFFKKETTKDRLGWGRTKYRMRGHAERDFWRWVCSWSRACRKPSDLGYDDARFVLPELVTREHEVKTAAAAAGRLFDVAAETIQEQQAETRRTLRERCEKVAELTAHGRPAVAWCHLNDEGDLLEKLIPGAVQVSGSDPDEVKEEKLAAFASGQARVMVTKPTIAGFGLNWQHCAHQTYFPSHSFEQFYQGVRRCWRFGQQNPVTVDVVTTEGGSGVLANLMRKQAAADRMFAELVRLMNESLRVERTTYGTKAEALPTWLASTN